MESYGFWCHQYRAIDVSTEAYRLSCNTDLGDGRYHFVQMLVDRGASSIETQRTYQPEYDEPRLPGSDPELALTTWLEDDMKGYDTHIAGDGEAPDGETLSLNVGARRVDGFVAVRALCGIVIDEQADEPPASQPFSACEPWLLRTVKRLSQSQPPGAYRVPAPSAFAWQQRHVRLVSGHAAQILDGRFTFSEKHTPCRWISDCCSTNGSFYLGSCRTPSEAELNSIEACLADTGSHRSPEFEACLQRAGVKVGCEVQADGSQICY